MSSQVRVLSVTHVHPDTSPPHADDVVRLSFIDALFVTLTPIQHLFFYEGPDLPPFPALVRSLKSSLAATLAVFPPLAGKLTYRPESDDVVIDSSSIAVSPGVKFIEAEYSGVDMHRLASDDEHHTEAFMQLVPELEATQLPAAVLAVQVTRPAGDGGGAVAVGVSVHHTAADGQSVWQFMRAWSAASREGSPPATGLAPPTFDRAAVIRHPKGEELANKFLRMFATALPSVVSPFPAPDITRQRRKTYLLRPNQIQSLKQRILVAQSETAKNQQLELPTTHVAVSSLIWTSILRAKSTNNADGDAYFMFPADCRRRLRPPVDDGFFGNCIKSCYARAAVRDLCGGRGLAHASAAVQKAIRKYLEDDDPLADAERWIEVYGEIPSGRLTQVISSHRFMAYETDFGWGAPSRVELVSVFRMELVMLVAARSGGVQVSVALDRAHMEAFETNFLQVLG